MKTLIVAFLVKLMLLMLTPGYVTHDPFNQETKEEGIARYNDIASAVYDVVYDENEKPLIGGKYGRLKSAWAILGVAYHEGKFKKSVDYGQGKYGKGDFGDSWCSMQLNLGKRNIKDPNDPNKMITVSGRNTIEGWSGNELLTDRKKCFAAGYHLMKMSFATCRNTYVDDKDNPGKQKALDPEDWMGAYAGGGCKENKQISRDLVRYMRMMKQQPTKELADKNIMKPQEKPIDPQVATNK